MYVKDAIERSRYHGIWVICELEANGVTAVSLELLGEARRLAAQQQQPVVAVLMGKNTEYAELLFHYGAQEVIVVEDDNLEFFYDELNSIVLGNLIRKYLPAIVLCGATVNGRALMPRLAVQLHCGLTADCTQLSIDQEHGALLQTRPAFGGSLMATIRSDNFLPQLATVRPGCMEATVEQPMQSGKIIVEKIGDVRTNLKTLLEASVKPNSESEFQQAKIIVAGGRGIQGERGLAVLNKLATKLNGVVGATRAVIDAGWAPYNRQIGQTGKNVRPDIYIACGISGQIQHLVGMQNSKKIIAINKDKDAPIMKIADIAIVGDLFEIVESLLNNFNPKH